MAKITVTFEGTKDRLRRAHKAAKAADRLSSALYDRWLADALTLSKGQPIERAVAMLLRTAVMLEIAAERKGWPDRIAGLPDRTRSPRAAAEAAFGESGADATPA